MVLDREVLAVLVVLVVLLVMTGLVYLFYPALVLWLGHRLPDCHPVRLIQETYQQQAVLQQPLLSIVIPAYNEEQRLPVMLKAAYSYLCKEKCPPLLGLLSTVVLNTRDTTSSSASHAPNHRDCTIEWILVNDGSKDGTSRAFEDFVRQNPQREGSSAMLWKLVELTRNSGKGAAVKVGMLQATGKYCLMVDADGATDFGPGLEALVQRGILHPTVGGGVDNDSGTGAATGPAAPSSPRPQVVIGSRASALRPATTIATTTAAENGTGTPMSSDKRSWVRSLLARVFHAFVVWLIGCTVHDSQCGFKLFTQEAAQLLFTTLHLQRWAFDIELLYVASHAQPSPLILREVYVPWQEIPGSKLHTGMLNLILASVGMLRDMICVRLCYALSIWTVQSNAAGTSGMLAKKES